MRNPGGAYGDAQKQYIYDPFTKETGVEVVIVANAPLSRVPPARVSTRAYAQYDKRIG